MKIERVTFVTHDGKPDSGHIETELAAEVRKRGATVDDADPDLVIALGGDGTVLRAAQVAHRSNALLVGINLGSLGYLTEVDGTEGGRALDRIFAGDFSIESRLMLDCRIEDGDAFVALNEVLVDRAERHLVKIAVHVDGEYLATFNADGALVATPTGSTAYALSAGGPVVSPRAECLIVVPVSPHMIFARPFVLAPEARVRMEVTSEGADATLSVDGSTGCSAPRGTVLSVGRHERALRVVRLGGPDFIQRLRIKLDLPG
ncbi:MAG: kinase [Actinomycetota bacterium]|jgi:NAD+ kinase|nr:kinase [Actinomycetota bacterium]